MAAYELVARNISRVLNVNAIPDMRLDSRTALIEVPSGFVGHTIGGSGRVAVVVITTFVLVLQAMLNPEAIA